MAVKRRWPIGASGGLMFLWWLAPRLFELPSTIGNAKTWVGWLTAIGEYVVPALSLGLIFWASWEGLDTLVRRITGRPRPFVLDTESSQIIRHIRRLRIVDDWPHDLVDLTFNRTGLEFTEMSPRLKGNLAAYLECGLVETRYPFRPDFYSASDRGKAVVFDIAAEAVSAEK